MYMNAYHKAQGEVRMFEVDARNAIARFPEEWSAEPWPTAEGGEPGFGRQKNGRTRKDANDVSEHADEPIPANVERVPPLVT